MIEARHLERIEAKLNQLQAMAESRGLTINGYDSADPQARAHKLGPEHLIVGMVLNSLADLYSAQGRLGETESMLL